MERLSEKVEEIIKNIKEEPKIFSIVSFIVNILVIGSIYYFNPLDVNEKHPLIIFFSVLLFLFITVMTFFFINVNKNISSNYLRRENIEDYYIDYYKKVPLFKKYKEYISENGKLLLYLILSVFTIYSLSFLIQNSNYTLDIIHSIFINFINITLIIGALSVIYIALDNTDTKEYNVNEKNISVLLISVLKNLIFYIPCLFIDLIEYIKYQYEITTKTVWIVLLIEIILIGLYFIIPIILNNISSHDGTILLRDSVYLNQKHSLGTFEELHNIKDNKIASPDDINSSKFKYNYAISGWYYINPQPPNTSPSYNKYTTIIDYGQKPLVQYNASKNTLRVQCKIKDEEMKTLYESDDIKVQRWNNIVINYDSGTMDIFINNNLVSSTPNIAPYMTYERVDVGEENGIHGGICNVTYYKHILSQNKINLMYKLLRNKEIPII